MKHKYLCLSTASILHCFVYTHLPHTCRSESPSQVYLILIQWLLTLANVLDINDLNDIILAYDNMCNLQKLHVAQKPLPFEPPYNTLWLKINKIIDVFHFPNHVSPACKELYSPAQMKLDNPSFNTQVGEQTFTWISRFKHILCAMNKTHHLFFLHRMVLRRNAYTSKCYKYGRKPILPKTKFNWCIFYNVDSVFCLNNLPCNVCAH